MQDHIPFAIQLQPVEGRIVLSGDLDGSREAFQKCEKVVKDAVLHAPRWIIDASQARLPPGGVETWIQVVREYMVRCQLDYLPSQLALNLQCDDEYTHPNSNYLETTAPAGCTGSTCWAGTSRHSVVTR